MVAANKEICSSYEPQQEDHKIYCDKRVPILGHYNSWLMSSQNFSYIVYASTFQGDCSHRQDQIVSGRLRNLAATQTINGVCIWLPMLNCLLGRFLSNCSTHSPFVSGLTHRAIPMDYSG